MINFIKTLFKKKENVEFKKIPHYLVSTDLDIINEAIKNSNNDNKIRLEYADDNFLLNIFAAEDVDIDWFFTHYSRLARQRSNANVR